MSSACWPLDSANVSGLVGVALGVRLEPAGATRSEQNAHKELQACSRPSSTWSNGEGSFPPKKGDSAHDRVVNWMNVHDLEMRLAHP